MTINNQIATGIIIAGGLSSKFNLNEQIYTHKALSIFKDVRLVDFIISKLEPFCNEVLIVVNNALMKNDFENQISSLKIYSNIEIVIDQSFAGIGPLRGILTGFYYAKSPYIFITACDALISSDIVQLMLEYLITNTSIQASAIFYDKGIIEPNVLAIRKPVARNLIDILKETDRKSTIDILRSLDHIVFFKLEKVIPTIEVKDDLAKLDSEEDDKYKPLVVDKSEFSNPSPGLFIKTLGTYKNNNLADYKVFLRQEIKIWENTPFKQLLLYILVDLRNVLADADPEVVEIKEKAQQLRELP